MENSTQKSKEYYKQIGRVWSPALNDYVAFNNVGFTHLLRKQGIPRAKSEQKRRLSLLANAVEMIADPTINIQHQEKEILPVDFWKLIQEKDGQTIKVVIRQFKGGKKHFLSVYAK